MIRDPASDRSGVVSNCTAARAHLFSNCSGVVSNCTVEGARQYSNCSESGDTGSGMFFISGNSVISRVSTGVICVLHISLCCAAGWWSPVALIKF